GTFAVVYLGKHRQMGYLRALKLLKDRPGSGTPRAKEKAFQQIKQEVLAMEHLNDHPNVARFHDVGQFDGRFFFLMEYVDGTTIKDDLDGRPVAPARVGRLLNQLCSVLQRAHAHDPAVIHRDLKPGNLMIVRDAAKGKEQLKVLDFGMAKLVESGRSPDDASSTFARFGGTPAYASPEQFGDHHLDGRSDLYSVGVILYELLTGRLPFDSPGNVFAWSHVHRDVPPPPFASRNPAVRVSPALEAVVMRCLAKEPSKRYQTANQLTNAYDEALASSVPRPVVDPGPRIPNPPAPAPPPARYKPSSISVPPPVQRPVVDKPPEPSKRKPEPKPGNGDRHAIVALVSAVLTTFLLAWIVKSLVSPTRRPPTPAGSAIHHAILADVTTLDTERRKYARYFSNRHLVEEGASADLIGQHRQALARTVNRLSRVERPVTLTPVDQAGTIFRIDLRETGWDALPFRALRRDGQSSQSPVNLFDLVLLEYPYGVVPQGSADYDRLDKEYLRVASLARPVAYVRGDWFVTLAGLRPLSEDLPGHSRASQADSDAGPESRVVRDRYAGDLTFGRALAELGGASLASSFRRVCALPSLNLKTLTQAGGSISRELWEASYPEVIRALRQGRPVPNLDNLSRRPLNVDGLNLSVNASSFRIGEPVDVTIQNLTDHELAIELVGSRYGEARWIDVAPDRLGPGGSTPARASWKFVAPERLTVFGRKGGGLGSVLLQSKDEDVADRVLHPVDLRDGSEPDPSWRKRTLDVNRD
ncbi:MAG: serine/threonine-protein kinase, partial [Isosphaeraceae bacterium]